MSSTQKRLILALSSALALSASSIALSAYPGPPEDDYGESIFPTLLEDMDNAGFNLMMQFMHDAMVQQELKTHSKALAEAYNKATQYYSKKNYAEAVTEYKKVLKQADAFERELNSIDKEKILFKMSQDDMREALKLIKVLVHHNTGIALYVSGNKNEAKAEFIQALPTFIEMTQKSDRIKVGPNSSWVDIGKAYGSVAGTHVSSTNFMRGHEEYRDQIWAILDEGYQLAVEILQTTLGKRHPDTAEAYAALRGHWHARHLTSKGAEKEDALKKERELTPLVIDLSLNVIYPEWDKEMAKKGKTPEPFELALRASTIGFYYAEMDDYDNTIKWFEKYFTMNPPHMIVNEATTLADAYEKKGDVANARKYYEVALKANLDEYQKTLAKNEGRGSPNTIRMKKEMQSAYEKLGASEPFDKWFAAQAKEKGISTDARADTNCYRLELTTPGGAKVSILRSHLRVGSRKLAYPLKLTDLNTGKVVDDEAILECSEKNLNQGCEFVGTNKTLNRGFSVEMIDWYIKQRMSPSEIFFDNDKYGRWLYPRIPPNRFGVTTPRHIKPVPQRFDSAQLYIEYHKHFFKEPGLEKYQVEFPKAFKTTQGRIAEAQYVERAIADYLKTCPPTARELERQALKEQRNADRRERKRIESEKDGSWRRNRLRDSR
jgi:tetratricopeptide (TPR) repeat protein